jgi:hypothetical protein
MYYGRHVTVDTTLAHPDLVREFDRIARAITPGFSLFEYRWAALNMRKKGSNAKIKPKEIDALKWSADIPFKSAEKIPMDQGVYSLFESGVCLFVAGTENLRESVNGHQTITQAQVFEPELWRPNPERLAWQYVRMPGSQSDYRFGVVRSLVKRWQPIFNISRGKKVA